MVLCVGTFLRPEKKRNHHAHGAKRKLTSGELYSFSERLEAYEVKGWFHLPVWQRSPFIQAVVALKEVGYGLLFCLLFS